MKTISDATKRILNAKAQAGDNSVKANLWVGRPITQLVDDKFLEKQVVETEENISSVSIAVSHTKLMRNADSIFVAYISNGRIKIKKADYKNDMEDHIWEDIDYSQEATDVAICFDGTMPKNYSEQVEFKTEEVPWVFYILDGMVYATKLGSDTVYRLVDQGCTAISAIRAMTSEAGAFDFGVILFAIVNGTLFYMQFIDDEWKDAIPIAFGPEDVTYVDVAAFRTWDYRVGIQAKSSDGKIYEMFTQYMGIGKQNVEHVEISNIDAKAMMDDVKYNNTREDEHVEISNIKMLAPHGGLYSILPTQIIDAYNMPVIIETEDGEVEDWGKIVIVSFDNYFTMEEISSKDHSSSFSIIDANGNAFIASKMILNEDECSAIFEFADFNAAKGKCRFTYTKGTLRSIAGIEMENCFFEFTPENLNAPQVDPPIPVKAWCMNDDGTKIAIRFNEGLTGDFRGNESKFNISFKEYDMQPEGKLVDGVRNVASTEEYVGTSGDIGIDTIQQSENITIKGNMISLEVMEDE